MICLQCDGSMRESDVSLTGSYRDEQLTVTMPGVVCDQCGYSTIPGSSMGQFRLLLADEYRRRKGLLTRQEICDFRNSLGFSQADFAEYLGVGVASVKRWEVGKVQNASQDRLMRLLMANPWPDVTVQQVFADLDWEAAADWGDVEWRSSVNFDDLLSWEPIDVETTVLDVDASRVLEAADTELELAA